MFNSLKYTLGLSLTTVLLLGSLLPGYIADFNKLPSLVQHYQHHLVEHEDISFAAFLWMHYDSESKHLEDESHEDLPFFQVSSLSIVATTHEDFNWQVIKPSPQVCVLAGLLENHYAYNPGKRLFQPPRLG